MSFLHPDLTGLDGIITKARLAQDRYGVRGVLDFLEKRGVISIKRGVLCTVPKVLRKASSM
jgi:hypothetical protein